MRLARLLPILLVIAAAACTGTAAPLSPTVVPTLEPTVVRHNPADYADAINEAVRGYNLILENHVDAPSGEALLRGGLDAAREVTADKPALPAPLPTTDEDIAHVLAGFIGAGGDPEQILLEFFEGITDTLGDRHTRFLTAGAWSDFKTNQVAYSGYKSITAGGGSLVWIVDQGSPAAAAGLRPGDTILAVNGIPLGTGTSQRIPPLVVGNTVTLKVQREGEPELLINLTPESQPSAIQARMIEGGIAYVRITGFVPPVSSQAFLERLDQEMAALAGARPIGWILDLRSNGGGLVRLAAQTAARFGYTGTFAESTTRSGKTDTFRSPQATAPRQPVIVLINRRTGSSAEMLTTALRDAGLVRVVGDTSAGSVRLANYFEVAGGAMQITTADVKTGPERRALEGIGVVPDVAVSVHASELAAGIDAQLQRAISLLAGED